MTAGELIQALHALAPQTRVVVAGAEPGRLTTLVAGQLVPIFRDLQTDPWDGDYSQGEGQAAERAYLIGRADG